MRGCYRLVILKWWAVMMKRWAVRSEWVDDEAQSFRDIFTDEGDDQVTRSPKNSIMRTPWGARLTCLNGLLTENRWLSRFGLGADSYLALLLWFVLSVLLFERFLVEIGIAISAHIWFESGEVSPWFLEAESPVPTLPSFFICKALHWSLARIRPSHFSAVNSSINFALRFIFIQSLGLGTEWSLEDASSCTSGHAEDYSMCTPHLLRVTVLLRSGASGHFSASTWARTTVSNGSMLDLLDL